MASTGLQLGEALVHSVAFSTVTGLALGRERPFSGNRRGDFFSAGNSFPSSHSTMGWAAASVLAHRYPGPLTKVLAYGLAGAVSTARVAGGKHFPSDVVIGGMAGWLIGRQVVRAHEAQDLDGTGITFIRDRPQIPPASRYVSMDSWVYGAFARLQAWGYAPSAFGGLRPWSRAECARLVAEISEDGGAESLTDEARALVRLLREEFKPELDRGDEAPILEATLDTVYFRWTGIAGTPLDDGFHFASTSVNDEGRPFRAGSNMVAGGSGSLAFGPFMAYAQVEYQHAPADGSPVERPLFSVPQDDFRVINLPPHQPIPQIDRARLIEAYLAVKIRDWQVSVGKQALYWGPGRMGSLTLSNNAEAIPMLRIDRVSPIVLPSILGKLGPTRVQAFMGRLDGHTFVNTEAGVFGSFNALLQKQPLIYGHKFSFKPTRNLEFGISRTGVFGGPLFPFTFGRVTGALFATGNAFGKRDPGDRRTGFDFQYRLPGLRRWLVLYNDSLAEDEVSPIGYPRRSAMNPGLYMPMVPKLPKLELRMEGAYTDLPGLRLTSFFYNNVRYVNGYTNDGKLLGNWVGRQGVAVQFWGRYWLRPNSTLEMSYRHHEVGKESLKGGTLQDIAGRAELFMNKRFRVTAAVQYERWDFPLLSGTGKTNVTSILGITYRPVLRVRR